MPKRITEKELLSKYNLTEDLVKQKYIEEEYSLPDFKKEFGIPYKQTQKLLKFFRIEKRGCSEAAKSERRKLKYEKTVKAKFGVKNVSQAESIKEKKRKTFLKNYGVDNIWKSKSYYEWLDNLMLQRYGQKRIGNPQKQSISQKKRWKNMDPKEKEVRVEKMLDNLLSGPSSKLESRVSIILRSINVDFQQGFNIQRKRFDFWIVGTKILIEVNGDFWHANPQKYESNDILNFPGEKKPKAKELWAKDERKKNLAMTKGYKVIVLWENEICKLSDVGLTKLIYYEIEKCKEG